MVNRTPVTPKLMREKRAYISYLMMLQRALSNRLLIGYSRREDVEAEIKYVEAHLEFLELQIRLSTLEPKLN